MEKERHDTFTSPVIFSKPKGIKVLDKSEVSLGEQAILSTKINETIRESEQKQGREEVVEMERIQQLRGKKDQKRTILRY